MPGINPVTTVAAGTTQSQPEQREIEDYERSKEKNSSSFQNRKFGTASIGSITNTESHNPPFPISFPEAKVSENPTLESFSLRKTAASRRNSNDSKPHASSLPREVEPFDPLVEDLPTGFSNLKHEAQDDTNSDIAASSSLTEHSPRRCNRNQYSFHVRHQNNSPYSQKKSNFSNSDENTVQLSWKKSPSCAAATLLRTDGSEPNHNNNAQEEYQKSKNGDLTSSDEQDGKLPAKPEADHHLEEPHQGNDDASQVSCYFDETEEEILQRMLSEHQEQQQQDPFPNSLFVSEDLSRIDDTVLEMIQENPNLRVLYFDRVQLRITPRNLQGNDDEDEPELLEGGEDDQPQLEEDEQHFNSDDAPDLYSESSHASTSMLMEQLEEALAVNASLSQVAIVGCHPKVLETLLWGISCVPSNLAHLALEMWNVSDDDSRRHVRRRRSRREPPKYLIWEGLVETLKNTSTLETLYIGNCHGDALDATAMNWPLLAEGLAQNTTLQSLTIETLSWTQEATCLIANALARHPYLAQSEFIYENDNSALVTIRTTKRIEDMMSSSPAVASAEQSEVLPCVLEDSTNQEITFQTKRQFKSIPEMDCTDTENETKSFGDL